MTRRFPMIGIKILLKIQEEFKVMLFNRYSNVIGIFTVSQGGIAGTVTDPKLIFGCALKAAASGIILAHDHPSGSLQASQSDIDYKKLKEGGRLFNIQVLDHIIKLINLIAKRNSKVLRQKLWY